MTLRRSTIHRLGIGSNPVWAGFRATISTPLTPSPSSVHQPARADRTVFGGGYHVARPPDRS
jgi:hypothetical protein